MIPLEEIKKDLKKHLSPKRYEHTLGVEYTASCLAMKYGADLEKARLAGLLHDCAKYLSSEDQLKTCQKYHIPVSDYERKNLEGQKKFLDMLSQGGQKVSQMSGIQSLSGIAQASGSQMHNVVYSVGKFFGHNFKPWEAVSTAAKIGKIGKFGVPVITTAISIGLDIKQKRAEDKRIKEIKVARDNYDAEVRKSIKNTRRKLEVEVRDSILANYDNKLNEINQMKLELGRTISSNKAIQEKIAELAALYDYFLGQINLRSEVDEQTPIIL